MNNQPLHVSQQMVNDVIDLDDYFEYDHDAWYHENAEMLYDSYIHDMASKGFYTPSIADEMQNLGTKDSRIGMRLTFQMVPAQTLIMNQAQKIQPAVNHNPRYIQ